jgi:anti-anti-sigma factor
VFDAMTQAQNSNLLPLTFEREEGKAPGTVIFHFSGPFTARTVFESQSPEGVSQMFDLQLMLPTGELPTVNIFDLTDVEYMDSTGLGMVVRHYVRCQDKGVRFITAGASPRVLELFKLTNVDTVIPMIATVEEVDTH